MTKLCLYGMNLNTVAKLWIWFFFNCEYEQCSLSIDHCHIWNTFQSTRSSSSQMNDMHLREYDTSVKSSATAIPLIPAILTQYWNASVRRYETFQKCLHEKKVASTKYFRNILVRRLICLCKFCTLNNVLECMIPCYR